MIFFPGLPFPISGTIKKKGEVVSVSLPEMLQVGISLNTILKWNRSTPDNLQKSFLENVIYKILYASNVTNVHEK